jgi:chromosome segregation ATPase
MLRTSTLFVLAALAIAGCESPQDKTRDAERARQAADTKIDAVNQTKEEKVLAVEHKAAAEVARLEREGAKQIGEADLAADRKDNEATEALWRARSRARADASHKLDGLDRDVAELRARLEKTPSTTAAGSAVPELQAKVAALRTSIRELEHCTAAELESIEGRIKTGFDDLEQALAAARTRS